MEMKKNIFTEVMQPTRFTSLGSNMPEPSTWAQLVGEMQSGVHAPQTTAYRDTLRKQEAAEESGKTLMVMRNNRFRDGATYLKNFIDAGKMGEVYAARCGWQRRRGIPGKGGWFTTKEQSGGGPLIDLGVHMIDLAIWLMGNPTPVAVSANTYTKFADNDTSDSENSKFGDANSEGTFDVEDLAMGMIRFDNGAVLQIEFSWASNIKEETRYVELRGTKAGLRWDDNEVEFFTEEDGQLLDITPRGKMDSNGHKKNICNFIDVITAGAIPPNPSELLASQSFETLLHTMEEKYDYIIIDTPPVGLVADSLILLTYKQCG